MNNITIYRPFVVSLRIDVAIYPSSITFRIKQVANKPVYAEEQTGLN